MKIIEPSFAIESYTGNAIERIEEVGRTCYKSEDRIGPGTASKFVRMLRDRGHTAMFDHVSVSVRFICDRGVTHEMVRHRIGVGYAQESTRYCNYGKADEVVFIRPLLSTEMKDYPVPEERKPWWTRILRFFGFLTVDNPKTIRTSEMRMWEEAMEHAESIYLWMVNNGVQPQHARSVLPNSLKTEIVVTGSFTYWRHFFALRTAKGAHPQMLQLAVPLLAHFNQRWPEVFDDIIVDADVLKRYWTKEV